jgi:tetratricopeptide (TPR) repeat protein
MLLTPFPRTFLAIIGLLLLASCKSPQEKAAIAAAQFDQFFAAGNYYAATLAIDDALEAQPDDPDLLARQGQLNMAKGILPQAYMAFQRVLDVQPNNVQALEIVAQLAAAGNDSAQAKRYLDTLSVLSPGSQRGKIAAATLAMNERRFNDGLAIINGVLRDSPGLDEAIALKARILSVAGKPGAAAAVIEARLPATSVPQALLPQLLDLYKKAANQRGIDETFIRLYRLQPDNPTYRLQYARAMFARGDKTEAEAVLAKLRSDHPRSPEVRLAIIRTIRDFEGRDAAFAEVQAAEAAPPSVVTALATYLLDDDRPAEARRILEPLVTGRVSAENVDAQVSFAIADFDLGSVNAARARADAVLGFDATNQRALALRTEVALRDRQLERALAFARLLVSSYPALEDARLLLAKVHLARGEAFMAETAYRSAAADFPNSPAMMMALTDYLIARGAIAEAADAAQDFTQLNPRSLSGWRRQEDLCGRAKDASCVAQARSRLAADAKTRATPLTGVQS